MELLQAECRRCLHADAPEDTPCLHAAEGRTCLHAAVSGGHADKLKDLLENLKHDRERAKNLLKEMDRQGNTVLHLAIMRNHLDMVKQLVAFEPDLPSSRNRDNETAIYVAVKLGFLSVVQELVKCSLKSEEIVSKKGKNILHLAVELSQDKILKFLVENVDLSHLINQPDEAPRDNTQGQEDGNQIGGDSPLLIVGRHKNVYMVEASIDNTQGHLLSGGNTPLRIAARNKNLFTVEPSKNNTQGHLFSRGNTPLHIAGRNKNVYIVVAPRDNIQGQEDENQRGGDTPLHIAARNKNDHMVDLLLKVRGVNKDAVNRSGLTPLDIARENTEYDEPYKIIEKLSAYPSRGKPFLYSAPTVSVLKQKKAMQIVDEIFADRRNVELVVATLLATMTFTGAFAVPGGFSSEGVPQLIDHYSFKLFLIFDCLAFFLSLFVVLMWEMTSPFTTTDKFLIMYLINRAAVVAFAFTAFSLMAAMYMMLAHRIQKGAAIVLGSSIVLILIGVIVFLFMAARFTVRIARLHRLCGVAYIVDDIVEKFWVKFEKHGMLDAGRSCDYFCHRLIWGDLF